MQHIHMIGIGGSGLSAIARVLLERGERVSGSDRQASAALKALAAEGAEVMIGHRAENVRGADLVVRSSAIPDDNVEVQAALTAGIPVLKRADFLADLLQGYEVIAVAGTHGKTTTTGMVAWMLTALGEEPSFIMGGDLLNLKTNAQAGAGNAFVIEADEYDGMFLGLSPQIAVVTNIEHDHPDCYPTMADFYQAFQQFAARLVPGGSLIGCVDDPGTTRLLLERGASEVKTLGYGMLPAATGVAADYYPLELVTNEGGGFSFTACFRGNPLAEIKLQVPGLHNVRNVLAALAVADVMGQDLTRSARALSEYRGTGRRFEIKGEVKGITVIDDYAHHPTEIRATLAAARGRYPQREIWAVWQPHTYSRTRTLLKDYLSAFKDADHVLVTEVYAAREQPPANGFSSRQVVATMQHPDAHYTAGIPDAVDLLLGRLQPKDLLIVLSAGDADQISAGVLQGLSSK